MNAGTCWGKNTIDPRDRGVERPRKATLPLPLIACLCEELCMCDFFGEFKKNDIMRPKILIFKNISYFSTSAYYKHDEQSCKCGSRGSEPVYSFRKMSIY
jgi:hypothetical protein